MQNRSNTLFKRTSSIPYKFLSNVLIQYSLIIPIAFLLLPAGNILCQKLRVNDLGYFETTGLNVFVFSNEYNGFFFDEKTSGIEIIQHGVRTATGGAVRLQPTPEQWDQIPVMIDRKVDRNNNSIEVKLRYKDYDFDSKVTVTAKENGVEITVYLDKPLPEKLINHAGFNLEFLPASYFEKTFFIDGSSGIFPLYPSSDMMVKPIKEKIRQFGGYSTFDDRGKGEFLEPKPIASGKTITLAPEDPERCVKIQSLSSELMLLDGRNLAQNGWFVVRSLIPSNKTGKVVEWFLSANTIPNWKRTPVIAFSQVGYHPSQEKKAVIELDKNDSPLKTASLYQVTSDGKYVEKLSADVQQWGKFFRYNYITFDFSTIKDSGLYYIQYGEQKTNTFPISTHVYENVWHQTLDVWFPVQMDHMFVREAYRIWHGLPFMDDALQAPVNTRHFDGYWMDSTTHTKYKSLEHIPGLNVGGWFDAGDFDIETAHHASAILSFVDSWELFGLQRDETFIDQKTRYVDIHHPDGKPDLLQQIEHGTLQLVAQFKNIGFAVRGINFPHLYQYHHLGDGSTMTDNLLYNPKLQPYETDGLTSGTMDDRWVFTMKIPFINYSSIAAMAAASRALKDYNKQLSEEALSYAISAWDNEHKDPVQKDTSIFAWFYSGAEVPAALQLYISTKDERYAKIFNELIWKQLDNDRAMLFNIATAARAISYMDKEYKNKLEKYVIKYKNQIEKLNQQNPYGVLVGTRGWAGNHELISWAIANYYLNKAFPNLIGREYVYRGLNYIFGCHPYSNISFVAGVGTHSKKKTYGSNRADFSFIAGGVVPGVLILKPDFPENKEDWPFLWGENECVIDICADYIFLANAANDLINKKE
jgi:Glycosyl hydrolase family 9./N-terminal ig-like domain of cellulase.